MKLTTNMPETAEETSGMTVARTQWGWVGVAVTTHGICRLILPQKNKKTALKYLKSEMARTHSQHAISLASDRMLDPMLGKNRRNDYLNEAIDQLQAYFSGERILFDLPIDTRYYTRFQQAVWKAAALIPFGETRSYAWIARKIQNPKSARAVGQALGDNPLPIIIPCHRVVNASGALGGFRGGSLMKKKFLTFEAARRQTRLPAA